MFLSCLPCTFSLNSRYRTSLSLIFLPRFFQNPLSPPAFLMGALSPFFFLFLISGFVGSVNGGIADDSWLPQPPPPPSNAHIGDIAAGNSTPSLVDQKAEFTPFRPSIAVIVGVLTTMFSITFLLLLYAKHCKRGGGVTLSRPGSQPPETAAGRKNSGIDRSVIESLPIFRFGSLRGQKDGLECAVCLTRFEPSEVLRLLPKCKHAFHVECVDTWLDAHSTCPLCRYRVDPEDILLVEEARILHENQPIPSPPQNQEPTQEPDSDIRIQIDSNPETRRISGRHSSALEARTGFVEIVLQKPGDPDRETNTNPDPTSYRRSLDSVGLRKKAESVGVGCFDHPRKDGLLLPEDPTSLERRFGHRIIVSSNPSSGFHQRWSDLQPSDLLYLRSEMIISDSRRFSSASGSRPSVKRPQAQAQHQNSELAQYVNNSETEEGINGNKWSGRSVINTRSVSEITGLSRFSSREAESSSNNNRHRNHNQRERQVGVVSRWLAWISQSRPEVRS